MKVDDSRMITSSSPLVTVSSCWLQAYKNEVYLLPKELEGKVAELHLSCAPCGAHRLCPGTSKITSASRLKALPLLRFKVQPRVLSLAAFDPFLPGIPKDLPFWQTLRGSSSSAGRPRHESSIAKNCLRSSSTWTSGVLRDKGSLPNSKVQKPDGRDSPVDHV